MRGRRAGTRLKPPSMLVLLPLAWLVALVGSYRVGPAPCLPAIAQVSLDRWPVKVGTDQDAGFVDMGPRQTTIEALAAFPSLGQVLADSRAARAQGRRGMAAPYYEQHRAGPVEFSTWQLEAVLVGIRQAANNDFLLVLRGESGQRLVARVPNPNAMYMGRSRWRVPVAAVRAALVRRFHPRPGGMRSVVVPVRVVGVGFLERHPLGVGMAANGACLYPVLALAFPPVLPVLGRAARGEPPSAPARP